jgi:integrase
MDLRLFAAWCAQVDKSLFEVQRVDIECYAPATRGPGRARSTVARRLCTLAGFYRYAEQEGLIDRSPAVHVRPPRLDYESIGLDRNELGALLVAAGLAGAKEHALVSPLALNGLRVSEALGIDIEDLNVERGHRTVTVIRKGGKIVTMPLAPRVARAVDLAISDRAGGPCSWRCPGAAWTATPPAESCTASPAPQVPTSTSALTACATPSSPPPSTPASPFATCKKPPATRIRAPSCAPNPGQCRG